MFAIFKFSNFANKMNLFFPIYFQVYLVKQLFVFQSPRSAKKKTPQNITKIVSLFFISTWNCFLKNSRHWLRGRHRQLRWILCTWVPKSPLFPTWANWLYLLFVLIFSASKFLNCILLILFLSINVRFYFSIVVSKILPFP